MTTTDVAGRGIEKPRHPFVKDTTKVVASDHQLKEETGEKPNEQPEEESGSIR